MEIDLISGVLICFLAGFLGFLYGKYTESLKFQGKKYEELPVDELEDKRNLSLFRDEPKDSGYLKKELEREKETKRKLVEQYESEIGYLKGLVSKNQNPDPEKEVLII